MGATSLNTRFLAYLFPESLLSTAGLTFDVQTNRAFLAATSSTLTSGYNWDVIITSLGNQWPVGVWFHAAVTFSTSPALVTVFLNGNQVCGVSLAVCLGFVTLPQNTWFRENACSTSRS